MILLVLVAGGFGAVARFLVDAAIRRYTDLPVATLVINIGGSFLLGVVLALTRTGQISPAIAHVLGAGFCGGFTTFSTATVESLRMGAPGERGSGVALAAVMVIGCVLAAMLGVANAR